MTHLDTSFLIRSFVSGTSEHGQLTAWIKAKAALGICVISWTEFLCGPVSARETALAQQLLGNPVPFGPADAAQAARLFNASGRRRGSMLDCMIAAQAINANAEIATSNRGDFEKLKPFGVQLVGD